MRPPCGLDQTLRDRQTEPGTAGCPIPAGVGPAEPGEGVIAEAGRKPGTLIDHRTEGRSSPRTATRTTVPDGAWRIALSTRLRTTRPSAVGLPCTCTRVDVSSVSVTPLRRRGRGERFHGLVGDFGEVDGHWMQVEAATLDAGEQEEVVDQRGQCFHVSRIDRR